MKRIAIILITVFLLTQCDKRPDTRGYKEELKDRELMRVTAGQLDQFVMNKAKLIVDSLEKITKVPEINPLAKAFIDTISVKYKIQVEAKQLSDLPKASKAYQLLDAYGYNMKNNIANEDNIQKLSGADTLLFTRAIVIKDSLWGMWMVSMPKKEMIKRITLKDIKQTY
jgi:hypothetical protein